MLCTDVVFVKLVVLGIEIGRDTAHLKIGIFLEYALLLARENELVDGNPHWYAGAAMLAVRSV